VEIKGRDKGPKSKSSTKDTKGTKSPYTLEELLAGVTQENLHPEIDTGSPVGREVWQMPVYSSSHA
jgi:hypothetical protein